MVTETKKEFRTKIFKSAESIGINKPEINVMHSDRTLWYIQHLQTIEDTMNHPVKEIYDKIDKKFIETNKDAGRVIGDSWKDFKERVVKMYKDKHKEDRENSDGWIFLLKTVQRVTTNKSSRDFNKFARRQFDPLIKEATYTSKESHDEIADIKKELHDEIVNPDKVIE